MQPPHCRNDYLQLGTSADSKIGYSTSEGATVIDLLNQNAFKIIHGTESLFEAYPDAGVHLFFNNKRVCYTDEGTGLDIGLYMDKDLFMNGQAIFFGANALSYSGGTVTLNASGEFRIDAHLAHEGSKAGFFNTAPISKPTGVAVTAAGIHAALVSLGLIAA